FFSSRRRHTRSKRDWSSDVCSSDLKYSGYYLPESSLAHQRVHAGARSQYFAVIPGLFLISEPFAIPATPGAHGRTSIIGSKAIRSEERRVGKEEGAGRARNRQRTRE